MAAIITAAASYTTPRDATPKASRAEQIAA